MLKFLKGKGTKAFSPRKRTPNEEIVDTGAFQGHQARGMEAIALFASVKYPPNKEIVSTGAFQGHQGNDQGAWRQSPLLPP